MWAAEATAMAGIRGSVVSMWKVTTPVGRSMIVFSVTCWVPLYTRSFMLKSPVPKSATTKRLSPSPEKIFS